MLIAAFCNPGHSCDSVLCARLMIFMLSRTQISLASFQNEGHSDCLSCVAPSCTVIFVARSCFLLSVFVHCALRVNISTKRLNQAAVAQVIWSGKILIMEISDIAFSSV